MSDTSRDCDIRRALHQWLLMKHAKCPDTAIIHELDIPRPSGRVDVALINGRLSGYEIKSSVDTLARLTDQEPSFSAVFERMTLVVTQRHLNKSPSLVPDWWEILEAGDGPFRVIRRGRPNPTLSLESALYVLSKAELQSVQQGLGLIVQSRLHKEGIVAAVLNTRRRSKILGLVREALKRRMIAPLSALAA
ncbi:MAG TPA: sce7726 family protein [Allosphingosinicella sp.]